MSNPIRSPHRLARRAALFVCLFAAAIALGAALAITLPLNAQSDFELVCDPQNLLDQQAAIATQVADFETMAGDDAQAALQALYTVGEAYQALALECGFIPPDAAERPVGDDVALVLRALETVYGDPINGQLLYNDTLGCANCHIAGAGQIAPHTEGTYSRVLDVRLLEPAFQDYTPTQYLVESIVQPMTYTVPGYPAGMPTFYGQQLTLQEVADLLIFLESQDGPSPE